MSESTRLEYDHNGQRLNIDTHDLPIPLAAAIASELTETDFFLRGGALVGMLNEILGCDSFWTEIGEIEYGTAYRAAFMASCQLIAEEIAVDMFETLADPDGEFSILSIRGSARVVDFGDDNRIDDLNDGIWSGLYIHDFEEAEIREMSFDARRSGGFF